MLSVITLTTAVSGSGKTYVRGPVFLIKEFLPNSEGVYWSNLPLYADKIAAECEKRYGKPAEDYAARLQPIPKEVLAKWRAGKSGPWDFFEETDLQGAHIAIDEVHNFCSRKAKPDIKLRWQEWLGEIRHRGATIELISQHYRKIATELVDEAGTRLQLVGTESRRDPLFGIALKDWYELKAKFLTGTYDARTWQIEKREVDGRWVNVQTKLYTLDGFFFQFYDSYSAPHSGGKKGSGIVREYQRRGRIGLLLWFLKRNFVLVASRIVIAAVILWMLSGGTEPLFKGFIRSVVAAGTTKPLSTPAKPPLKPSTRPASSSAPVQIAPPPPAGYRPATQAVFRPHVTTSPADPDGEWEVIALLGRRVIFANGDTAVVGERIVDGPYAGRLLMGINYAKLCAVLSDGRKLYLTR